MIETILHLFKIHRKMKFGNPTVVVQDMLGKRPETLNAVNVVFRSLVDQAFRVIHLMVFPQTLKRVVTSKPVRKVDRALPRLLPDYLHQFRSRDSLHHPRVDPPIALQQAENNAFTLRSSSSLSLLLPPK